MYIPKQFSEKQFNTMKFMLEARDNIDQELWWETKIGHVSIWSYNWT